MRMLVRTCTRIKMTKQRSCHKCRYCEWLSLHDSVENLDTMYHSKLTVPYNSRYHNIELSVLNSSQPTAVNG